ncbi:MAG: hypothetical protein JRD89_04445 [Deltaproteobacteria bacterium]|nr:hypothetical protein [Deltaproteobacteria bacterium]
MNSTALMLLLEKKGIDFESIFVDHGGDYPETYEYIDYLRSLGHKITTIVPDVQGFKTIEEFCLKKHVIPTRKLRFCTFRFKLRPMYKYVEKPCILYVGISADESRRISGYKEGKGGVKQEYPLVEWGITRQKCIQIIEEAKLRVPRKSGCWLCPFMPRKEVRRLYLEHPDLYQRRKALEKNCRRKDLYLEPGIPIEKLALEDVPPLTRWM